MASCANASLPRAQGIPGGNEGQERKDAVSGRKDGERGAGNTMAEQKNLARRISSVFGGRPQCADEQRKGSCNYCLANVAALPTANVQVTRARWLRQHAIDVATHKVHPGGKNSKGRDCVAEQLEKT